MWLLLYDDVDEEEKEKEKEDSVHSYNPAQV